jgi:hypothetical protein
MSNFWIKFVINEALAVVGAFIGGSKLSPAQQTAAEALVTAGSNLLANL